MTAWLRAAAASQPVAVALDDLHNADAETLALLEAVSADLAGCPVLLLAAYRPAEAAWPVPAVVLPHAASPISALTPVMARTARVAWPAGAPRLPAVSIGRVCLSMAGSLLGRPAPAAHVGRGAACCGSLRTARGSCRHRHLSASPAAGGQDFQARRFVVWRACRVTAASR